MNRNTKYSIAVLLLYLLFFDVSVAQQHSSVSFVQQGTLSGTVMTLRTRQILSGVTISLHGLKRGAVSRFDGTFVIRDLPSGTYTLSVTSLGYKSILLTDIVIRQNRNTSLEIMMEEQPLITDNVYVTGDYFRTENTVSATTMNFEEVRRSPSGLGDIGRALATIPSAIQIDDAGNDLIVRGGAPFENGYYIDNIFTPNINHFPQMGAGGGNISMLNIDFVKNVTLTSGAFASRYGNRLSSVIDIQLREGSRDNYEVQADVNMSGFGAQFEGPISSNASFMLSGKRSYLDLVASLLKIGGAPRYSDAQGKLTWKYSPKHTLSVLNIFGHSEFSRTKEEALTNKYSDFGIEKYNLNTLGISLQSVWNESLFSLTTFSWATIHAHRDFRNSSNEIPQSLYDYTENYYTFRNINTLQLSRQFYSEFGIESQFHSLAFEPSLDYDETNTALFVHGIFDMSSQLRLQLGLRAVYYTPKNTIVAEPRFSAEFQFHPSHKLTLSWGVLHQSLPAFLIIQSPDNTNLLIPQAKHFVFGWEFLWREDTRISVEIYSKKYNELPLSQSRPYRFPVDDVAGDEDEFQRYGTLVSTGEAWSKGIEFLLQRKMSSNFYTTIGLTVFASTYQDYFGNWRNRLFDNRGVFSIVGGWKISDEWECSARWIYAGGKAVTPIDRENSLRKGFTVYKEDQSMQEHLPDYHSLSLRVDKRWHLRTSTIITYLSVLNAYNRSNVRSREWDPNLQDIRYETQFSLLPIIGIEWEM